MLGESQMLTRRLIRIKVLQTIYLYEIYQHLNGESLPPYRLEDAMATLRSYLNEFLNLQHFLLSLLPLFSRKAQELLQEEEKKHLPREEYLQLLRPLAEDALCAAIHNNNALLDSEYVKGLEASLQSPAFLHIFQEWLRTAPYKQYVATDGSDKKKRLAAIQEMAGALYSWLFSSWYEEIEAEEKLLESLPHNNQSNVPFGKSYLQKFFLDAPLTYTSDLELAARQVTERIHKLKELPAPETKLTTKPVLADELEFAEQLLLKMISNSGEHQALIKENLHNWELDRLKKTDLIIIELGITELLYCPDIPTRVTLNEYVDIASQFAANEALPFINGVLDNILRQLESKGRIHKNFEAQKQ